MMKYPNASKGVKKILISEIIALAAAIMIVVGSVAAFVFYEDPQLDGLMSVINILIFAALGAYIFGYVLQIIGIVHAGRDEPAFKVSLFSIIAILALIVLETVFHENHVVSFILEIAGDVAQFFLVHYIIHGIMHLSERLGRPDMVKKGNHIFWVIYVALGFEIIVRIFEIIFGKELGASLSMPFGIVANILQVVENVLFVIYIGKGNKLLREN